MNNILNKPLIMLCTLLMFTNVSVQAKMTNLTIFDKNWPSGKSGNYGTFKYFIDEENKETIPIKVTVEIDKDDASASNLDVEVFTNLNRRDFAKIYEDPESPNREYWMSHKMNYKESTQNKHIFEKDLNIANCGAYRLTARYKVNDGEWIWFNDFITNKTNQRDAAIVVSPKKALGLRMYELNLLTVEANNKENAEARSTIEDLTDKDNDEFDPFNLNYVSNKLGFNTIWIMPIHPKTKRRNASIKFPCEIENYIPGSPYSTRDYWSIDPLLSDEKTSSDALDEFKYFVNQAEKEGINIFLDVAFNHAGKDIILGQGAYDIGLCSKDEINNKMIEQKPNWISNKNNYRMPATNNKEIPLYSPIDREGEHDWLDAQSDFYFGNYSSLGPKPDNDKDNPNNDFNGALNEKDQFYTDFSTNTIESKAAKEVWQYFAYYIPYWLKQTDNQIDGIRADFAQGLPPRAWEYIINKARQKKWDFIFLAEVLDPTCVQYRANRHFDIITTKNHDIFRNPCLAKSIKDTFDSEMKPLGYNAAILHNGTSHDESDYKLNGDVLRNKYHLLAKYAVASTLYGPTMVYMGQPLGVDRKIEFQKKWDNMHYFWTNQQDENVYSIYQKINKAREEYPALQSLNNYFLNRFEDKQTFNKNIYSIAKWDKDNIILAFINLDPYNGNQKEVFFIPQNIPLDNNEQVKYNVYNLISNNPNKPIWSKSRTTNDIHQNGIYVDLKYPNEIQYLLLKKQ